MRTHCALCCVLLLAACASQPAAPAFHAPQVTDESATAADSQPLALEGAPDTAASAAQVTHTTDTTDDLDVRHVTVLVGGRKIHDNTADDLDLDEQLMLGAGIDMYDSGTGHGFEAGLEGSGEDGRANGHDVDLKLFDLYGGYRYNFRVQDQDVHPYLAGGLALVRGDLDVGPDDDDDTLGAYLRAGVGFDVSEKVRLGIDYRHMFADLEFFGDDFDANWDQLAFSVGFPF
ncbi:MAG TPA: outer membrane beta-barrel protein [Planctomycetota bacterium]|nr:outer membrane beta-barrel protein [Planctomycetota bacterium]